jgi:hypothetical protein
MEDDAKKVRSPAFPFIPLEKAVQRAQQFETAYAHNWGRIANIAKVWEYTEKSSGGIQTVAALVGFGLMEDEGKNEDRRLHLTPLALTILKDKRPGAAEAAIKTAALNPKVLAKLWKDWGAQRPPAVECESQLHLDMKFTEEAAKRLLKIYDATIAFAKLAPTDKPVDNQGAGSESGDGDEDVDSVGSELKPKPGKVPLMQNERVVFAHEIRPDQSFRIVATGPVDAAMVKALKAFTSFQEFLVTQHPEPLDSEESSDK